MENRPKSTYWEAGLGAIVAAAMLISPISTAQAIETSYGEDPVPNSQCTDDFIDLGYGIDPIPAKSPSQRWNAWRRSRGKGPAVGAFRRQVGQPRVSSPRVIETRTFDSSSNSTDQPSATIPSESNPAESSAETIQTETIPVESRQPDRSLPRPSARRVQQRGQEPRQF